MGPYRGHLQMRQQNAGAGRPAGRGFPLGYVARSIVRAVLSERPESAETSPQMWACTWRAVSGLTAASGPARPPYDVKCRPSSVVVLIFDPSRWSALISDFGCCGIRDFAGLGSRWRNGTPGFAPLLHRRRVPRRPGRGCLAQGVCPCPRPLDRLV